VLVGICAPALGGLGGGTLPLPLCNPTPHAPPPPTHLTHLRIAPFITHVSAAFITLDWSARRARVHMLAPATPASGVRQVPDVSATFPIGPRSSSAFDEALRWRCGGGGGLRLHVPSVCGANAVASLVLCCSAAVVVLLWAAAAAARAVLRRHGGSRWQRRPFKDKRENL